MQSREFMGAKAHHEVSSTALHLVYAATRLDGMNALMIDKAVSSKPLE